MFINTVLLCFKDYSGRIETSEETLDEINTKNSKLEIAYLIFLIIYTIEVILKIYARGLIYEQGCFLTTGTNWQILIQVILG